MSGIGRLPQPQDPVSISAAAGSNSTLIIPFRNPLDHAVLCDVTLTGTYVIHVTIFILPTFLKGNLIVAPYGINSR